MVGFRLNSGRARLVLAVAGVLMSVGSAQQAKAQYVVKGNTLSPRPVVIEAAPKANARNIYPTPPIRIAPIENVRYRSYNTLNEVNTSSTGMHVIIELIGSPQHAIRLSATNRLGEDLSLVRFQLIIDFVDGKELEGHASLGPIRNNERKAIVLAVPANMELRNTYYYFLRELKLLPINEIDFPQNSWRTYVHYPKTRFAKSPSQVHPDRK